MREHELRAAIQELERQAAGEPFTREQKASWNELNEQLDQFIIRRERLRELDTPSHHDYEGTTAPHRRSLIADEQLPAQVRAAHDEGLRAIAMHESVLGTRAADQLDRLVREGDLHGHGSRYMSAVANPHYEAAFAKMLRDPQFGHLRFTPQEVEAVRLVTQADSQRSMAEGTGSAGGFALPFTLDPTILFSSSGALNPMRQLARTETILTREWKGLTADTPTAAYAAEGTEASDNSPTLVQPDIFAEKAQMFVPFSIELEQDWSTLHTQLKKLFSDAKDILEATKFLSGLGHGNSPPEPVGILSVGTTGALTTTQRVQTATVATYAAADPWSLKAAIPARWIPSAVWFGAPGTWDTTWQFVAAGSTTQARQFDEGRGGPFLGRPKYEWTTMATGSTTGTKLLLVGDPSTYLIVDRIGMNVELAPLLLGPANRYPTGQRGLYAYWRNGGAVLVPIRAECDLSRPPRQHHVSFPALSERKSQPSGPASRSKN
jgi:HK97 family phage major capsid protein